MIELKKYTPKPIDRKVILFPKTYQDYQISLTCMLEGERYSEAIQLLQILLKCDDINSQIQTEWNELYEWLLSEVSDHQLVMQNETTINEDMLSTICIDEEKLVQTEEDMLKDQYQAKLQANLQYTMQLFSLLKQDGLNEHKFLILEQLVIADDPQIDSAFIQLLQGQPLNPFLQFGILQAMKRRGINGEVCFPRNGNWIRIKIEETPLDYASFPPHCKHPVEYVNTGIGTKDPSFSYFTQEIWYQYLKYIYGSTIYCELFQCNLQALDAWAAALHYIVGKMLHMEAIQLEVEQRYDITDTFKKNYEYALRLLTESLHVGQ